MDRLAGQVGGHLVVDAVLGEVRVAQVAPQHGEHAQPMGLLEGARDLDDLAVALLRAEVDRRADGRRAQLVGPLRRGEHRLVVLGRVREQLVVVQLDDERELVRPLAADRAHHADRRRERVAAALDGELDQVLGVEVDRVGRERRRSRVLDALVDGQDRVVARARQPPGVQHPLEVAQDVAGSIGVDHHPIDEVGARQVQVRLVDGLADVVEQAVGLVAQQLFQARARHLGCGHNDLL